MESFEECLLKYRMTLRQELARAGVPSNPGVTDDWLLEKVVELIRKREEPLDALRDHMVRSREYGYSWLMFPDVLQAIELARQNKLRDVKVGF